jgi:hypothetical protein
MDAGINFGRTETLYNNRVRTHTLKKLYTIITSPEFAETLLIPHLLVIH